MKRSGNLVTASWLAARAADPAVVIVDCRFELTDPGAGRDAYERAHIPRAVHLDLERDLSGPKAAHGGRHPLPPISRFSETLGRAGIDERVEVVAYDAQQGCMAARLWWMLRYLGHDRVRVLDGGWPAWQSGGFPTTSDIAPVTPRTFVPRPRDRYLVDVEGVRRRLGRAGRSLVDSRAAAEKEAGDILLAVKEGAIAMDHVRGEIGEVFASRIPGRTAEGEITVFKSLGQAVEDAAAAKLIYERAKAEKLGTEIAI